MTTQTLILPTKSMLRLSNSVRGCQPQSVEDELEYYRKKAIHQDILIFEMRALLQSGKGFGNMLDLAELLDNFMAVAREKYSARNSAVLLHDELEPERDYYRVKAFSGLDDRRAFLKDTQHSSGNR